MWLADCAAVQAKDDARAIDLQICMGEQGLGLLKTQIESTRATRAVRPHATGMQTAGAQQDLSLLAPALADRTEMIHGEPQFSHLRERDDS